MRSEVIMTCISKGRMLISRLGRRMCCIRGCRVAITCIGKRRMLIGRLGRRMCCIRGCRVVYCILRNLMHEVLKKLQSGYLTVWGVIAAAAAAAAEVSMHAC